MAAILWQLTRSSSSFSAMDVVWSESMSTITVSSSVPTSVSSRYVEPAVA